MIRDFCTKLKRKRLHIERQSGQSLHRTLTTLDLTLFGIGGTLGIGMYVLTGTLAKTDAGPAIIISFCIAAVAALLSALCYAEFSARVPSCGSAYAYSYAVMGEFVAFTVGWSLVIESVIGVACVGRAFTSAVDILVDKSMVQALKDYCGMGFLPLLGDYFDPFALLLVGLSTILLLVGIKESATFNNVFTCLNLGTALFVVFAGIVFSNFKNWALTKEEIFEEGDVTGNNSTDTSTTIGEGGFAPFGISGIMRGAASCFYAYVGFDGIPSCAEESKTPQKSIPIAITMSILLVFLVYMSVATVVTTMVPYYLQDNEAPLAEAFVTVGYPFGKWIVSVGALFGHTSSLISGFLPIPRIIYSMACDGVLFKSLSKLHGKTKTPYMATVLTGLVAGAVAALCDLEDLIDLSSVGCLTAYSIVSLSVLCLRYQNGNNEEDGCQLSDILIWTFGLLAIIFTTTATFGESALAAVDTLPIVILCFAGFAMVVVLIVLASKLPKAESPTKEDTFRVPLVPWIPSLSILVNFYLMTKLSWRTWVHFGILMGSGFIFYGICLCRGTTDRDYQEYLSTMKKQSESKLAKDDDADNKPLT